MTEVIKASLLKEIEIAKYNIRRLETLIEVDMSEAPDVGVPLYCCINATNSLKRIRHEFESLGNISDGRLFYEKYHHLWLENTNQQHMNIIQNNMGFGEALKTLNEGGIVSREGWNGKGMFLKQIKENEWKLPDVAIVPDQILPLAGFIGMKTADSKFVPWLASQTDILANDWCVVNF